MTSIQPGSLPPLRVCSSCGQAEGEHRLKTCAKCNTVLYCSRDCQTTHWKVHKKECRKPNSDTNQQPSKTPILGPWDDMLYKPTTPMSFLRRTGKPTPEEVKKMSDELPEITRRIYNDPQNSALLVNRAMHLSKLGFADIAAGDAYKAIQLLDASLRRLFGSSRSNYDDLSGIPSAIEAVSAEAVIQHKTSYIWFVSILVDTGDKTTAQKMIQKARARYPSDPELETMEKSLAIALEEQEKARQLTMATIDPKYFRSDPKFGSVRHLAYPFIPKAFLSRSEQLIRTISREIEAEARAVFSGCSLRSSPVQDPTVSTSSGAPTALGVFATCDIAKGFPFLIDTTVLAATDTYGRSRNATEICDNCYGTIPMNSQQKRSATCCAVVYCSQNCRDLAWKNYHQVLCKQEFNWVWDDSRTGYSEYDLDGPMWLRILAVCVQSRTHPLEHSLFARLTPLYDEHLNRRWSLSNNIVMPIKILQQLGIDIYTDSRYDTWILQTLWARILTNVQIEVSSTPDRRAVRAINPYYSFLNHSCEPNANSVNSEPLNLPCEGGSQKYLWATRKIKKGEEITISYMDLENLSKEERMLALSAWIGIEGRCGCHKCERET